MACWDYAPLRSVSQPILHALIDHRLHRHRTDQLDKRLFLRQVCGAPRNDVMWLVARSWGCGCALSSRMVFVGNHAVTGTNDDGTLIPQIQEPGPDVAKVVQDARLRLGCDDSPRRHTR